jgi:hypothetical protein
MYATGIGLVLYGIEKSEEAQQPDDEQRATPRRQKATGKVDIFADMDHETPATPSNTTPQPQEKEDTKHTKGDEKGAKKGESFQNVIGNFIGRVFGESIDD